MLHTEFQDHRTSGSGEDFNRILPWVSYKLTYEPLAQVSEKLVKNSIHFNCWQTSTACSKVLSRCDRTFRFSAQCIIISR